MTNAVDTMPVGVIVERRKLWRSDPVFAIIDGLDDPGLMRPDIAGRPVYLAMAMTPSRSPRLKPQNLLVNLPLAPEV